MSSFDQNRCTYLHFIYLFENGQQTHVHLHNIYGRKSWLIVNKKEVNLDIFWVNLEINNSKLKKLKNSRLTSGQCFLPMYIGISQSSWSVLFSLSESMRMTLLFSYVYKNFSYSSIPYSFHCLYVVSFFSQLYGWISTVDIALWAAHVCSFIFVCLVTFCKTLQSSSSYFRLNEYNRILNTHLLLYTCIQFFS